MAYIKQSPRSCYRGNVVFRVLAVACLVGCGFRPNPFQTGAPDAAKAHDAPTADSSGGGPDAARDASSTAPDAAPDAPPTITGSLAVSSMTLGLGDQNLTSDGTADWAHWGYRSPSYVFDRKQGGSAISDVTGTPDAAIGGAGVTSSWTDGTPDATGSMDGTGYAIGQGHSFQLTVAAGTTPATLDLHVSAKCANARLDAALSDGSAPSITKSLGSAGGLSHVRYTITFNAASAGQTLTITWSDTQDFNCGPASPYAALFSAALH